ILPIAALLGGFMSTLYPVCVAHAHDRLPTDQILAVSSRLILMSGLASVLGPFVGMTIIRRLDIDGALYLLAAAAGLLAVIAAAASLTSASPSRLKRPFEILTPEAAFLAHDPAGTSEITPPDDSIGFSPDERRSA